MKKRIIVAITGASGSIYAKTLIDVLTSLEWETEIVITQTGQKVFSYECGEEALNFPAGANVHDNGNLFSSLASGSLRTEGMVVVPCSMNTLGLIAAGTGDHLLARAAQVTLKERRKLLIVPREMPYSIIHLENMLRVARAGGIILPPSPGFYHHPQSIQDLVQHVVGKILDLFDIEHSLYRRWEGKD